MILIVKNISDNDAGRMGMRMQGGHGVDTQGGRGAEGDADAGRMRMQGVSASYYSEPAWHSNTWKYLLQ